MVTGEVKGEGSRVKECVRKRREDEAHFDVHHRLRSASADPRDRIRRGVVGPGGCGLADVVLGRIPPIRSG